LSLNVKGTKAAEGSMISKPNFFAISYPNFVAPILGTESPPVETTREELVYEVSPKSIM